MTLTLQQATGKNVVLLSVGASDDGAHSQNEKIDIRNYIEGVSSNRNELFSRFSVSTDKNLFFISPRIHTKLLGSYLYEVAQLD